MFPSLPGLAWNVSKAPTFQTRIQRAVSGRELRALDYQNPLWQFSLVFEFLRDNPEAGVTELRNLMGFFMACQGAFSTFLFDDPTDDSVTGQFVGTGDGSTTTFQLVRTLAGGGIDPVTGVQIGFTETITAPQHISAVYFGGVAQPAANYNANRSTGTLSFVAGTQPAIGVHVTVDFSYYFRCRFMSDSYAFENFMFQLWTLKKMDFISAPFG